MSTGQLDRRKTYSAVALILMNAKKDLRQKIISLNTSAYLAPPLIKAIIFPRIIPNILYVE